MVKVSFYSVDTNKNGNIDDKEFDTFYELRNQDRSAAKVWLEKWRHLHTRKPIGCTDKWKKKFIAFSDFSEFMEFKESLKHELGSI